MRLNFAPLSPKPVIAFLAVAGIVTFTAACGSGGSGSSPGSAKLTVGPSGSSSASTSGAGLGLYDGNSTPSGIKTAANWLGSPSSIKYAEDFIDATAWANISNPWQLDNWKNNPYTMVWGVPMLPCGGPSTQCAPNVPAYDKLASGGANDTYKTLAKNLVSAGFGSSYIRIGWEFNGSEMGWAICDPNGDGLNSWAKDFVPGFRNIVTSMRSVSGANFKFIWNPLESSNVGCDGDKLENFYPGDSYVDAIALDVYDGLGGKASDTARWTDLLNGVNQGEWTPVVPNAINGQKFEGYGLNWIGAFGKEHNKEISVPEWGLDSTSQDAGGGDDKYFMSHMADWIKANATGPSIFWNFGNGNLPLDIPHYTSGKTPAATAAFKAAFSSTS